MDQRSELDRLLTNMLTIYIESRLASPFAGMSPVEVNSTDTIRQLLRKFFVPLDEVPGLSVYDNQNSVLDWDATVESQGIREGDTLYLVHNRDDRPIHIIIIAVLTTIIATVLFVTASVLYGATGGDIPFDYGIVIDAGSTHTEVFLYQWSGSKYLGTGEVSQRNFCHIEKGISEGYDPVDIVSCVNNVTKSLPSDNASPVQCYLRATAGMRLLNASKPLEAQLILTAIKYALKTSSVKEGSVEIIPGQDEGLYAWITTNFLSKTLIQHMDNVTYGALDLGGGSTQIAFALNPVTREESPDIQILNLYGKEYNVLAKSFLCFGLSQAIERSESIIFLNTTEKRTIIDPCLPTNFTKELKTKNFLEGPCIHNKNLTSWLERNGNVKEIRVLGSSNYNECVENVKSVVNPDACRRMGFSPCLEAVDLAKQNKKFMAFSSYWYIVNYLSPNGSLSDFVKATRQFCSLSYKELKNKTSHEGMLSHLLQYCFGAIYIKEILTSTYGFTDATWENIKFQQNIRGADVGWALGFMINATNAIPEEMPKQPVIGLTIFIALLVIGAILFLLVILLVGKRLRSHNRIKDDVPLLD